MKKMQRKVKGFTLTELAIVIAVIAILIAVLVPTFTSLINKSRESSDSQLANNMNTLLSIAGAESTPTTMGEVNAILEDGGYKLENLNPTADGNVFVWDENSNTISYIDEDGTVLYAGNSALTTGGTFTAANNYWLTVKTASDISDWSGVSYYIASDAFASSKITLAGASRIDTGDYTVGTVEYSSSATSSSVTAAKTAVGKNVKKLAAENLGTDTAAIRGKVGTVIVSNENISVVNYAVVTTMSVTTKTEVTNSSTGKVTTLTLESNSGATLVNDGYVKTLNDNSCTVTNNGYVNTATNTSITSSNSSSYEYTIASYNELLAFSTEVNGGAAFEGLTVKLTADITANSSAWTPIGNSTRASGDDYAKYYFAGTFDGQGYSISGITYEYSVDNWGASIFGVIKGATIKNVTVKNCTFKNTVDTVAGLIAFDLTDDGRTTTIENIVIESTVILTGGNAGGVIGRIYGTNSNVNISDCNNYASADGTEKAGGIATITKCSGSVIIEDCNNYGDLTGNTLAGSIGGVLAYANYLNSGAIVEIINCVNYGGVGSVYASNVGGICGYNSTVDGLIISDCTNNSTVTGKTVGGIFGVAAKDCSFTIKDCTNNGAVTGTTSAGGIVGSTNARGDETSYIKSTTVVSDCKNTATVNATESTGAAGGVVGTLQYGKIENCSGGQATISAAYAGRLVGSVVNAPSSWAEIAIDDSNSDDYTTGLFTVGAIATGSAWGKLIVLSGTLYGIPINYTTCSIRFRDGTKWIQSDDEDGTINITTESTSYDTNYGVTYKGTYDSETEKSTWTIITQFEKNDYWIEDESEATTETETE